MNLTLQTDRLILRELLFSDAEALFKMDKNPNVHTYLSSNPANDIDNVTDYIGEIRNQYIKNRIGRFAVVLKKTNEVIGWAGIKFVTESENNLVNFYDIEYRLQEEHWGNGYAKEAAEAWLQYGFNKMKKFNIYASTHTENKNSKRILERLGMKQKTEYNWNNIPCVRYEITKEQFNR